MNLITDVKPPFLRCLDTADPLKKMSVVQRSIVGVMAITLGMTFLLVLFLFGPLSSSAESIYAATPVWPGNVWQEQKPSQLGMDEADLNKAREYAMQKGGGSGTIIRDGYIVMKWGDQRKQYDIKSSTKSIGVTTLGLALKDQKISLSDQAQKRLSTVGVPPDSNEDIGWLNGITIFHLATQTAGFEKTGALKNFFSSQELNGLTQTLDQTG